MRLRLKTYLVYTLVVLLLICLINVWMVVFVRTYVPNSAAGPMEFETRNRAEKLRWTHMTWSFENGYFENETNSGLNLSIKYNISLTRNISALVSKEGDVDKIKRKTLNTNYFRKYNTSSIENIPQVRSAISDAGNRTNDTFKTDEESSTATYEKHGKNLIRKTSTIKTEFVTGGQTLNMQNDERVNNSKDIYDDTKDNTSLINEVSISFIANVNLSNVTGLHVNIRDAVNTSFIANVNLSSVTGHLPNITDEVNTSFIANVTLSNVTGRLANITDEINTSFIANVNISNVTGRHVNIRDEVNTSFIANVNISNVTGRLTNITDEVNTSSIANLNLSNVTGRLTNITGTHIGSQDYFDITEHDDHIYLEENLDFKRMLEIDSDDASIPERRWKHRHDSNTSYADRKQVYNMYHRNIVNQEGVDCVKIIDKETLEIQKAKEMMATVSRRRVRPERYIHIKDCDRFKRIRGYIEHPLSELERNFPLAFGIIMYRDVEQTERLLRAIYRPHNYYCIHVDSKSDKLLKLAVDSIVRCLPNVFVASRLENVTWGEFTVLQADLNCMKELWRYRQSWKYYINLTGQEFPLKTNREIVKILEAMDGANIVDGTWVRANEKYFYRWTSAGNRPPHGIRPVKGSVHVLVTRHFVDFCLHDNRAIEFLAWLRKTQIPDETYFASLNHNPHLGIKGSFLGETEAYPLKPAFMRYKNWEFGHSTQHRNCSGKYVRHICILGVQDLHSAFQDVALFVNKFHLNYEYLALDCLEEVLHKKTWQQYLDDTYINVSYYKQLDYVKFKLA